MTHSLRTLANCSLLFTELPLLRRPEAARRAGFDAIELWWPFDDPVPGDAEVDAFVGAIEDAGVALVALNFYAGHLLGPDAGVLSIPARVDDFNRNVDAVVEIGGRLGVRLFNAPYGNRVPGVAPEHQDELATESLARAAAAVGTIGGTVLVEPMSGPKPYPLRTAADGAAVVERVRAAGPANVGLLLDLYHLTVNEDDIDAAIDAFADRVAHVQVADAPGRHEPGTGTLDIDGYLGRLQDAGYDGWVALEYVPRTTTLAGLPQGGAVR